MFYVKHTDLRSSLTLWPLSLSATKEGNKVGLEREEKHRGTDSRFSRGGRVVWTGMTDTTDITITNQDATEPPNDTLYTLSYYLHIYSLIPQQLGEEF